MKKLGIFLLLVVLVGGGAYWYFITYSPKKEDKNTTQNGNQAKDNRNTNTVMDGELLDIVFYKQVSLSSSKFFYNDDPSSSSIFGEKPYAYFNVVYKSSGTQTEVLEYYKNIFTKPIEREYPDSDMVTGYIDEYKVSATRYEADNTVYLQIHFPSEKVTKDSIYLNKFPLELKASSYLEEHELSYGVLEQNGGEVEYTKYYTIIDSGDKNQDGKDDIDEYDEVLTDYKATYKYEPNYVFDEKLQQLTWEYEGYKVTVAFADSHDRVYVMMRKKL